MKTMRFAVLFLLAALPATGQMLPFKPETTVNVKLTCGKLDVVCQEQYAVRPGQSWSQPLIVKHRAADGSYLAVAITSGLLTVADVENSIYALQNTRGSSELNPLYGSHPSRGIYYGVGLPVTAAAAWLGWKWKREDEALRDAGLPGHGWAKWWLPETLVTASHAVGIFVTLAETHK